MSTKPLNKKTDIKSVNAEQNYKKENEEIDLRLGKLLYDVGRILESSKELSNQEKDILKMLVERERIRIENEQKIINNPQTTENEKKVAYQVAITGPTVKELIGQAKSFKQETINVLDEYLKEASGSEMRYKGVISTIFNLLYSNDDQFSDAQDFYYLIVDIKRFLFNPDICKQFLEQTSSKYKVVLEYLERLVHFFKDLQGEAEEAEISRYGLRQFGYKFDAEGLKFIKARYEQETKIAQAVKSIRMEYDDV